MLYMLYIYIVGMYNCVCTLPMYDMNILYI